MAKFKFTYPDGSTQEIEMSDCSTPEQALNTHVGDPDTKVKCELIGAQAEPPAEDTVPPGGSQVAGNDGNVPAVAKDAEPKGQSVETEEGEMRW